MATPSSSYAHLTAEQRRRLVHEIVAKGLRRAIDAETRQDDEDEREVEKAEKR